MKRAIGKATKVQQRYQDAARELGCVVCRWRIERGLQERQCGPTHIHHRNLGDLHGQKQLGHAFVVALGAWHHDGDCLPGMTVAAMRDAYGPSFKHHAREFREWTQEAIGGRGTEAWQDYQDMLLAKRVAA